MSFWKLARLVVGDGCRLLFRVRVRGKERLPREGGFVLAPSHRSMMDIPFIALVTRRRVRYMGKAPLFRLPVLGFIFRALGGFPVERDGTDRKAVREAMAMLEAGDILVVFPEGSRQHGPKIQPLQPGAAYLALRAGVPLVPVGMAGTEEIMRTPGMRGVRLGRVAIVVGDPLTPPPVTAGVVRRERVDTLSDRLRDELQRVFDDADAVRER